VEFEVGVYGEGIVDEEAFAGVERLVGERVEVAGGEGWGGRSDELLGLEGPEGEAGGWLFQPQERGESNLTFEESRALRHHMHGKEGTNTMTHKNFRHRLRKSHQERNRVKKVPVILKAPLISQHFSPRSLTAAATAPVKSECSEVGFSPELREKMAIDIGRDAEVREE